MATPDPRVVHSNGARIMVRQRNVNREEQFHVSIRDGAVSMRVILTRAELRFLADNWPAAGGAA